VVSLSLNSKDVLGVLSKLMQKGTYTVVHDAVVKNVKQLMFWTIAGSPRESIKPPIDTGDLRAKVFAIVDGKRYPLEATLAARARKRFMKSKKAATQYYSAE
jgi:hypothetical protein